MIIKNKRKLAEELAKQAALRKCQREQINEDALRAFELQAKKRAAYENKKRD